MEEGAKFAASLYSPQKGGFLCCDGSDLFAQSDVPVPWTIEVIDEQAVRLQLSDGRYLRSDGDAGTPPGLTHEPNATTVWLLLYSSEDGAPGLPGDETPVQIKTPFNVFGMGPCLDTDTPTGGGRGKGKYSWCGQGDDAAFWRLKGASTL